MGIHHATQKKAEGLGVILTEVDGEIEARWPKLNKVVVHDDAKTALRLMQLQQRFGEEYRHVSIRPSEAEEDLYATFDKNGTEMCMFSPDDDIEQVFIDTLEFAEANDCEIEDTTEHVVVPVKYKILYKERGNPNHCGDWLSHWMDGRFATNGVDAKGKAKEVFDHVAFEFFLRENGVDMDGKWAALPTSGQNGWVGRYRMNGRQRLEIRIAINGHLVHQGNTVEVDPDFLAEMQTKHKCKMPKVEAGA